MLRLKSYILSKFSKPELPTNFIQVYQDKFGNKWYALKNPAKIAAERALTAWAYTEDSNYSLNRKNLRTILDNINNAINTNNLAEIAKLIGLVEMCLELYCHDEILLNLASVYTFLNDEKNEGVHDYMLEKKREIWETDSNCKSFFLQWSWQYTARYSEQPQLNVPEYLEKVAQVKKDIQYRMTQLKSLREGSPSYAK